MFKEIFNWKKIVKKVYILRKKRKPIEILPDKPWPRPKK